jgi:flagellar hook protein FlgE
MGFAQGLSGLNAASDNLDVIGNNVSNQSTVGYKSGTATFSDVFANSRIGQGVQVTGVTQNFTAGEVTSTGNELDMAIDGSNGFFRMEDTDGSVVYTRNGEFTKNSSNEIVNAQGQKLTGFPADSVGSDPVVLTVPTGTSAPSATKEVTVSSGTLDADAEVVTADFDSTDSSTYSSQTQTTVYDSMGTSHALSQYYVKTGDTTWDVHYLLDGDASTAQTATLTFNSNGVLETVNGEPADTNSTVDLSFDLTAASDLEISFDYGDRFTQYAGESSITASQDGYAMGQYSSIEIGSDGTLSAIYTNGQRESFGIVALASFSNPAGLQPEGGNAWSETADSGAPTLGQPGSNNLDSIIGQSTEASNVDVNEELVNLIIAQRAYQANAKTITAQDEILGTLVNM